MKDKIPVLKGFVHTDCPNPVIVVWCPYCQVWHTHGYPEGSKRKEHRCAHCQNIDSPFRQSGYYVSKFTIKDKKQFN